VRRATSTTGGFLEEFNLGIRSGEVAGPSLSLALDEGGEFQPIPDSLRIEDLIGSGEFERSLSLRGEDFDLLMGICHNFGREIGLAGRRRE
jgi:hypothetical protein